MIETTIVHCGVYTRPETHVQKLIFVHIGLTIEGLDYMNFHQPEGEQKLQLRAADLPYLSLIPVGTTLDFRFNRRREDWVIQCRLPGLRPDPHTGGSLFPSDDGGELTVPLIRPLTMEEAFAFRERFARIGELHRSGTPADSAAAEWMTIGIVGELIAGSPARQDSPPSPATRLRAFIDADRNFQSSLKELSRDIGATPAHLRRLFQEEFRISPGEYRARRRLGRILELIDQNELSLKEIADAVGMRNVTHLYAFVRERCQVTPGELQKQRGGRPPVSVRRAATSSPTSGTAG